MLSRSRTSLVMLALATGALFLAVACSKKDGSTGTQKTASSAPTPGHFSTADLAKLRWIEGTWRGTGVDQTPFYERYRFENDSTLLVENFDSDKYDKVTEVSRFELKDGQFGEGTRSAATEIDNDSIIFYPLAKGNSWRWKRESKDQWQAIVDWPVGHRVYRMERWTPSKTP
jgi:hypothetical protein